MKKMFSFILLFCLFAVGCSGTTEPAEAEVEEEEEQYSLYGAEMIIADQNHNGTYVLIPNLGDNALSDLLLERYSEVEKTLDCTVSVVKKEYTQVASSFATGEKLCDIMNTKVSPAKQLIDGDLLYDCSAIEGMDIRSGKFGGEAYLNMFSTEGAVYAFVAAYWGIPSPYISDAMLFNPRLIKEHNLTSPHEYAETKQWTWDNFMSVAEEISDMTSDPENPLYAAPLNGYFEHAAYFSNGAEYIAYNSESGKFESAVASYNAVQAMEWIKAARSMTSVFNTKSTTWEAACDDFSTGKFAFLTEYSWVGLSKDGGRVGVNMLEPFSWIYFPRGPQGDYDNLSTISGSNDVFCIPVTADTDIVGYFAEELFKPMYDTEYGWRESMSLEVFFDKESEKLYFDMLDSAIPDYSFLFDNAITSDLSKASGVNNSPSEILYALDENVQTAIDSFFYKQ